MDLNDIVVFTKVVETKSFTGAADALGLPKSTVSRKLAQLEERLDPRRFLRIHRGTLVNLALVQELYPAVDGGVLVRLKDDARSELSVARDRVRDLKRRLEI